MPKIITRAAFGLFGGVCAACLLGGTALAQFTGPDGRVIIQKKTDAETEPQADLPTDPETGLPIEPEAGLPAPIEVEPPKNRVGEQIMLRTLDKVTANTKDFIVNVGDSLNFGTLRIDVKHCEAKPPEAIPETFAFLQIFEPPRLSAKQRARLTQAPEPEKIFSGWMLASKPAVSALDHSVYDVWVVGCKGGEIY